MRKNLTVPVKNAASVKTLKISVLVKFVKNAVKKKQSAVVDVLKILSACSFDCRRYTRLQLLKLLNT